MRNPGCCFRGVSIVGDVGTGVSPLCVFEANFDEMLDSHEFFRTGDVSTGVGVPLVNDAEAVVCGCEGLW